MKKFKSIVVGVDFSHQSTAAVKRAREFAKKFEAPIVLVHAFEDPFISETRFSDIIASLKKFHGARAAKFYKVGKNESVTVQLGRASDKILDTAKKLPAPLIIAGHRGLGNALTNAILGSTAEKLITNSVIPVWIERGNGKMPVRKALIPTDLTDRAAETVKSLKTWGLGDRQKQVFHVINDAIPMLDYSSWREAHAEIKKMNEEALKKFKKKYPKLSVVQEWGGSVDEILRRSRKFDFIAISPRRRRGFFSGFGSVTSKLVRTSPISVLVLP